MHNLAIALHLKGLKVTGSDDEIVEPSLSRLEKHGLLPDRIGWNLENIHIGLDAVILGMHAKADNPELLKAKELGLPVYSYPEFIYQQSLNKQRVVVAGSHGKTTITAMILHVLKENGKDIDFLVGAQLPGFETMVRLSDAPVIIIEGDEYLASPIDRIPKFLHYHHHMTVISGIAWDHINVFPTFDEYKSQFEKLIVATPKGGTVVYFDDDKILRKMCSREIEDVKFEKYEQHPSKVKNGVTSLKTDRGLVEIGVFGEHNLQNISAAKAVCSRLGVSEDDFYSAIATFHGAANRLELLASNTKTSVYKDFAHAPSKLSATTKALANQFPERKLVACLELHTFSSLNKQFLSEYAGSFNDPDESLVYFNPHTIAQKGLEPISDSDVIKGFDNKKIKVFTDSNLLLQHLKAISWQGKNLLMMSSGNFGGMNLKEVAQNIISLS
ncbi:MAG: peptidoglycan synthetase [Cytophagales bacterium]|nr:peptidoglycan synthetase [Cytophagales bacterium]